MSCHVSAIESFIAIYLRHGPAKNRVIYRKNCRDKEALGKVFFVALGLPSGASGSRRKPAPG